jgi:hypothetical protein
MRSARWSGVLVSDEPIVLGGKRATTILTRRVKQIVAEWYVLESRVRDLEASSAVVFGVLGEQQPGTARMSRCSVLLTGQYSNSPTDVLKSLKPIG